MRQRIGRALGMLLIVLIPLSVCYALATMAGRQQYEAFWNGNERALWLYGRPADARYVASVLRMSKEARRQGFEVPELRLVQTSPVYLLIRRWESEFKPMYAAVDVGVGSHIILDTARMREFADDELDCVMAHEIGHVIDYRMQRVGHAAFDRIGCLDTQQFADSIGRMLCGYEKYNDLVRRVIKLRPLVITETCESATPP